MVKNTKTLEHCVWVAGHHQLLFLFQMTARGGWVGLGPAPPPGLIFRHPSDLGLIGTFPLYGKLFAVVPCGSPRSGGDGTPPPTSGRLYEFPKKISPLCAETRRPGRKFSGRCGVTCGRPGPYLFPRHHAPAFCGGLPHRVCGPSCAGP